MQGISFFRSLKTDYSSCICIQNGRVGECFVERDCRFQQILISKGFPFTFRLSAMIGLLTGTYTGMQKLHHFLYLLLPVE